MYTISLKQSYRWKTVQVAGQEFTKNPTEIGDDNMNDEIKNSSLLNVEHVLSEPEPAKPPKSTTIRRLGKDKAKAQAKVEAEAKAKAT